MKSLNGKSVLSILFFGLYLVAISRAQTYQNTIYTEKIDDAQSRRSLDDLCLYLKKITGQDFKIREYAGQVSTGIYILWNKPGLVSDDLSKKISKGSIEGFILSGTDNRLLMIANHPLGFSHAIYTYLDKLGVKWYFPGDEWEYIPIKKDISVRLTQYFTPSFQLRNFFGTGNIRPISSLDPNNTIKEQWDDWKRRNRMGGEIDPAGHYGEAFNVKYKDILERHPEYLALVNGKREAWSSTVKWCISNKDFRDLFIEDRVEELQQTLKKKNSNEKILLTVDPADGGGDCTCDNCKKIGPGSDLYFYLANEVAKAVAKKTPRAYVNLYAYNTHAAPPHFKLEPNVIVQIIPYAFQAIGSPEYMIGLWKKHHSNLLIYDYYVIPDWHFDRPNPIKNSPDTLVKRIKYWGQSNIKGFMLESTYSFGSAGLGLYLMARIGWDITSSVPAIKEEFYKNMFGTASKNLKDYYEQVGSYYQGNADIPYLFYVLDEADKNSSPIVHKRITSLEAYVHYLILFQQYLSSPQGEISRNLEPLMEFILRIYHLKVIHSTRIAELLSYRFSEALKAWSIFEPLGEKVVQVKPASTDDISEIINKDMQAYPLLEDFAYKSKGVSKLNYIINRANIKGGSKTDEIMFINFPETYIRSGSDGYAHVFVKYRDEADNMDKTSNVHIRCLDTGLNKEVYHQEFALGHDWKNISIKLPANKTYKLSIQNQGWIMMKIMQDQWIGFKNIPTYFVAAKLWFYVPQGTRFIYYAKTEGEHPVFINSSGKQIKPGEVNKLNIFQLGTGHDDGWWNITNSQYKFLQFYSIPDLFFTHPGYLVSASKKD